MQQVTSEDVDPEISGASAAAKPSSNRRILLRSHRDLRKKVSPQAVAAKNLIGNNSGNTIFAQAVHRTISVPNAQVQVDRGRAKPNDAARINENFDQYVIPLANAFRHSFQESLDNYSELIEQLTIPVVIVGVGVQMNAAATNPESLDAVRPSIERFMRAVLARSASVGVRGETTYNYLRSIGFSESEVTVIGCPSLFQFGDELSLRPTPNVTRDSLVTINISPYLKKMGPIATANTARYPNLRYIAQDILTLKTLLHGQDPPNANTYAADVPYRRTDFLLKKQRTRFFIDPTAWMTWLREREMSFGSRIHGNITSLLAGTPAFVLAHDSRTRELVEYHEIPYALLDSVDPDVDPRTLLETADYTALQSNHKGRFQNYLSFLERNDVAHVFTGDPLSKVSVAEFDAAVRAASWAQPITNRSAVERNVGRQLLRLRDDAAKLRRKAKRGKK